MYEYSIVKDFILAFSTMSQMFAFLNFPLQSARLTRGYLSSFQVCLLWACTYVCVGCSCWVREDRTHLSTPRFHSPPVTGQRSHHWQVMGSACNEIAPLFLCRGIFFFSTLKASCECLSLLTVFVNKVLLEPCPFIDILSMVVFLLQWQK